VHDTIALEQRGIPTAVIITQAFTKTAAFQFRAKGMPGHPSVVLPHPISNLTTADIRALTQRYAEQVVRISQREAVMRDHGCTG
jgi:hypothetical protein